jgi:hypothetical protein
VSQWRDSHYETPDAINTASHALKRGDVILLEAQIQLEDTGPFLPVEVELAVFDQIGLATGLGIIVVEAAGNGGKNLDEFHDRNGKKILNRSDPSFADSRAIMVGAGSPTVDHHRIVGLQSNFGSRIDCYAWGACVATTGDGELGTSPTEYTDTFDGTSSAAAIIAGAAIAVQGLKKAKDDTPYTPEELRTILSKKANGTTSTRTDDKIGVMPDLRKIIDNCF